MLNLINGEALETLRKLECDSLDSLITDPPAGISFMGKGWDSNKGGRDKWIEWLSEIMEECLRVLKPGAHGLVWAIPRTSHWTGTALEQAGFEVRDVVTHLFGTGFPKSLDVSKAIDKAAGAQRKVVGRKHPNHSGKRVSKIMGDRPCLNDPNYDPGKLTTPATPEAKQWDGWGTALKPAAEFWFLVRKPLSEKTVAKNVLKWGTGALNIDGCRIIASLDHKKNCNRRFKSGIWKKSGEAKNEIQTSAHGQGRFPANLVLSCNPECTDDKHAPECAAAMLDNNGGASRFFYCAKPSKRERGEGNTHPTVKPIKLLSYYAKLITPPNGTVLDPFMGSGSVGRASIDGGFGFIGIELEQGYFEIASKRCHE